MDDLLLADCAAAVILLGQDLDALNESEYLEWPDATLVLLKERRGMRDALALARGYLTDDQIKKVEQRYRDSFAGYVEPPKPEQVYVPFIKEVEAEIEQAYELVRRHRLTNREFDLLLRERML